MTIPSESSLDPAVRARLERLVAEAGPRRAVGKAVPPPMSLSQAPPSEVAEAAESEDPASGVRRLVGAFRLTKRHAWALALLVLVGVVASSGWTLRARAVEVQPPAPITSGTTSPGPAAGPLPPPTVAATATPTPAPVTVHVLGAVIRPGVVVIPAPARVRDVIAAAGGFRSDADPGELNLAAFVSDGAQVVVGTTGQPRGEVRAAAPPPGQVSGAAQGSSDARINLNTATADQLDGLPGVGPVTAQAILVWRTKHGKFSKVEELQEVDGIGPKTYAQIAPHVRV